MLLVVLAGPATPGDIGEDREMWLDEQKRRYATFGAMGVTEMLDTW
jgi:hypothetical protein